MTSCGNVLTILALVCSLVLLPLIGKMRSQRGHADYNLAGAMEAGWLANELAQQQRHGEAMYGYRTALMLAPTLVEAYHNFGLLLAGQSQSLHESSWQVRRCASYNGLRCIFSMHHDS